MTTGDIVQANRGARRASGDRAARPAPIATSGRY